VNRAVNQAWNIFFLFLLLLFVLSWIFNVRRESCLVLDTIRKEVRFLLKAIQKDREALSNAMQ
jgi:hypothetical protein